MLLHSKSFSTIIHDSYTYHQITFNDRFPPLLLRPPATSSCHCKLYNIVIHPNQISSSVIASSPVPAAHRIQHNEKKLMETKVLMLLKQPHFICVVGQFLRGYFMSKVPQIPQEYILMLFLELLYHQATKMMKQQKQSMREQAELILQVRYDYQGRDKACQIAKEVTTNFLFPCWINQYSSGPQGSLQKTSLRIIDSRTLVVDQNKKLRWTWADEKELQRLRKDGEQWEKEEAADKEEQKMGEKQASKDLKKQDIKQDSRHAAKDEEQREGIAYRQSVVASTTRQIVQRIKKQYQLPQNSDKKFIKRQLTNRREEYLEKFKIPQHYPIYQEIIARLNKLRQHLTKSGYDLKSLVEQSASLKSLLMREVIPQDEQNKNWAKKIQLDLKDKSTQEVDRINQRLQNLLNSFQQINRLSEDPSPANLKQLKEIVVRHEQLIIQISEWRRNLKIRETINDADQIMSYLQIDNYLWILQRAQQLQSKKENHQLSEKEINKTRREWQLVMKQDIADVLSYRLSNDRMHSSESSIEAIVIQVNKRIIEKSLSDPSIHLNIQENIQDLLYLFSCRQQQLPQVLAILQLIQQANQPDQLLPVQHFLAECIASLYNGKARIAQLIKRINNSQEQLKLRLSPLQNKRKALKKKTDYGRQILQNAVKSRKYSAEEEALIKQCVKKLKSMVIDSFIAPSHNLIDQAQQSVTNNIEVKKDFSDGESQEEKVKNSRQAKKYYDYALRAVSIWNSFVQSESASRIKTFLQDGKLKLYLVEKEVQKKHQQMFILVRYDEKDTKDQQFIHRHTESNLLILCQASKVSKIVKNIHWTFQLSLKSFSNSNKYHLDRKPKKSHEQLLIEVSCSDQNQFFAAKNAFKTISRVYPKNEGVNKNAIVYPYQEGMLQKSSRKRSKHFHLVNQGGGAKGLSYVGAYRSIRQFKSRIQEEEIPIDSVMGSSAGGIISLAISTLIPWRQMQKICYKMNDIPRRYRFTEEDIAQDEYGNEIKAQEIENTLYRILDHFGVIQQSTLKSIIGSQTFQNIKQLAFNYIQQAVPIVRSVLGAQQHQIDWKLFLLHGALMKGDAINQIAKQCLAKFFIKKKAEMPTDLLRFCMISHLGQQKASDIEERLSLLLSLSSQMIGLSLVWVIDNSFSQRVLSDFIIGLVNRYLVLMDHWKKLNGETGFRIEDTLQLIPLRVNGQRPNNLKEYFMFSYVEHLQDQQEQILRLQNIQRNSKQYEQLHHKYDQIRQARLAKVNSLTYYSHIRSALNFSCFINPRHCDQHQLLQNIRALRDISIIKFIRDIFPSFNLSTQRYLQNLDETSPIERGTNLFVQQLFLSLQTAEAISQVALKVDPGNNLINSNDLLSQYRSNYSALVDGMERITLEQYYNLSGIELTCTSVDLENKILRFFNHKTSPRLPVSKSIQMTGSFPGGFKAIRWQPQWGNYHVYIPQDHQSIILTGHLFTDGGMLANFPIKNSDNEQIRSRYFRHQPIKGKTILVGLGLDYLDLSRYQPSQAQIQKQKYVNRAGKIAMGKLKKLADSKWNKFKSGLLLLFETKHEDKEQAWSTLQHHLIKEIPLFKFLLKVLDAYPNADRNFNLEAFRDKILKEYLDTRWSPIQQYIDNQKAIQRTLIHGFINEHNHINSFYTPVYQVNQDILAIETSINRKFQAKKNEVSRKTTILHQLIRQKLTRQGVHFLGRNNQNVEDPQHPERISEQELSLRLIKVFFMHLKLPQNKQIADRYTRLYVFMKFIAEDFDYQHRENRGDGKQKFLRLNRPQEVEVDLTKISLRSLFNDENFEQIANHLGFYDFADEYYKSCPQNQEYLAYLHQKKKDCVNKVNKIQKQDGSSIKPYDVKTELRRVTQLIYLVVKGRQPGGRLKRVEDIRSLTKRIRTTNYKQLLYDQSLDDRIGYRDSHLTFLEIVNFLQQQVRQLKRLNKFFSSSWFDSYLNSFIIQDPYEPQFESLQTFRNIVKRYVHNFTAFADSELTNSVNPASSSTELDKWIVDDYYFVRNLQATSSVQQIMAQKFVHNIRQSRISQISSIASKVFYEMIYLKKPANDQADHAKLQQLDSFLEFVFQPDNQRLNEALEAQNRLISKEKKDQIQTLRKATIQALFYYLSNRFSLAPEQQQNRINFYLELQQRQTFQNNIKQFILLRAEHFNLNDVFRPLYEGIIRNDRRIHLKAINSLSLKLVELDAIRWYLHQKLNQPLDKRYPLFYGNQVWDQESYTEQERTLASQEQKMIQALKKQTTEIEDYRNKLAKLNGFYFSDMRFLLHALKEGILLSEAIQSSNDQNQAIRSIVQTFKQYTVAKKFASTHGTIFEGFVKRYYQISELPLNLLNEHILGNAFIIDYQSISQLFHVIEPLINRVHQHAQHFRQTLGEQARVTDVLDCVSSLHHLFSKLRRKRFSLPLFDIDQKICTRSLNDQFKNSLIKIVHVDNEGFSQANIDDSDHNIHLVLQGVDHSNEHFGGLYQNVDLAFEMNKIMSRYREWSTRNHIRQWSDNLRGVPNLLDEDSHKRIHIHDVLNRERKKDHKIMMITSANFHSIFGFLLALGYEDEMIRRQMYKLQFLANTLHSQRDIQHHFSSCAWAYNNSTTHQQFLLAMEKQHSSLFERIETLKFDNFQNISLLEAFKDIKRVYEDEKQELMKVYECIIDDTMQTIDSIDRERKPYQFGVEIAKKFGYRYRCELGERHDYAQRKNQSIEKFAKIALQLFQTFGTLIQGIIINAISQNSFLDISQQNKETITKGLIVNRLLTTFKLKQYIVQKLKQFNISPRVTLEDFYKIAPRKILLNFTTIKINEQQLAFLNKNTMPKMPLWAALLATSCLPFIHSFFLGNKDWQSSNKYHQLFIYNFFKANPDTGARYTRYTSGNYLSSIPLDLLTSKTINKRLIEQQDRKQLGSLKQFVLCFEPSYKNIRIFDLIVHKKYLNFSLSLLLEKIGQSLRNQLDTQKSSPHHNNFYEVSYSWSYYFSQWFKTGTFATTFDTLTNSNDNFILKWYYHHIVRLPIKVNTLDFDKIVDSYIAQTYRVDALSEQAQEAVERSYEVTKVFIANIDSRNKSQIFRELMRNSRDINEREHNKRMFYDRLQKEARTRYSAKIRAQIFQKAHPVTGFKWYFIKVVLFNHSKWNNNRYNNFVVEYCLPDSSSGITTSEYTRVYDSEVVFLLEFNTRVKLKFYYLAEKVQRRQQQQQGRAPDQFFRVVTQANLQDYFSPDNECVEIIKISEVELNFKALVQQLPLKDQFDYELLYGCTPGFEHLTSLSNQINQEQSLQPLARNGIPLDNLPHSPLMLYKFIQVDKIVHTKELRQ